MRLIAICLAMLLSVSAAFAQSSPRLTRPFPIKITAGLTFQVLGPLGESRQSLTIQNNNDPTDNCYMIIGGPWQAGDTTTTARTINGVSMTARQASILLQPGGSYSRYYPYVPSDQLLVTCASPGDSVYADLQ